MVWSEQLYHYCERGRDTTFWAEPVNAVTNLAFVVAAISAAVILRKAQGSERGGAEVLLVALVFVIAVGSFLFHTFATRWAAVADVVPITLFMLLYLSYALRRFLGLGWMTIGVVLVVFVGALWFSRGIACQPTFLPLKQSFGSSCLNGTEGYVPALLTLLGIGVVLGVRRHAAARGLLLAGGVFALSMIFRTMDFELCREAIFLGNRIGTHFVWHLLNAVVLFLLLRAALLHGSASHPN